MERPNKSLLKLYLYCIIGGFIFSQLNIPLPWLLGPLVSTIIWQGNRKRKISLPNPLKDASFIVLGIYFGLYFTRETFFTIMPYFYIYFLLTCFLIFVCIFLGACISRKIELDLVTSVFSSIPGGVAEMTVASEELKANSSLVVIYQSVRLIIVLVLFSTVLPYFFVESGNEILKNNSIEFEMKSILHYLWFTVPILGSLLLKDKFPVGIIVGALGITAIMNITPIELPQIPKFIMNIAQITIGASIGKNILLKDIRLGRKYLFVFITLFGIVIVMAILLGILFSFITSLNYATSILSFAPGGMFEMVIVAYNIGGDPAIVSALQLSRILLIVIFIPVILKWWLKKKTKKPNSNSTLEKSNIKETRNKEA